MSDTRETNTDAVPGDAMVQETSNGRIVRDKRGRFIRGTQPANVIRTPADGRALRARRVEHARDAAINAANESVGKGHRKRAGDLAYWHAIVAAVASKAANARDPKQVEAARFIRDVTGLDAQEHGTAPASVTVNVLMARVASALLGTGAGHEAEDEDENEDRQLDTGTGAVPVPDGMMEPLRASEYADGEILPFSVQTSQTPATAPEPKIDG